MSRLSRFRFSVRQLVSQREADETHRHRDLYAIGVATGVLTTEAETRIQAKSLRATFIALTRVRLLLR